MGANIVRALLTNAEFDQSYVYQASRSRAAGERDAPKRGMMIKVIAAGKAMMAKRSWCEMRLLRIPVRSARYLSVDAGVERSMMRDEHSNKLSFIFVFVYCIIASVTATPVVLIPAIFRASRIPVRVRLAASNCIFTSLCLIVPVFTAHCIWRRQYRELNGFRLVHEFFPAAPARMRPAVVSKHEPLSICDDEFFSVLFVLDYAYTSVAPFFMPMIIELPPNYFAFYFSVYAQ